MHFTENVPCEEFLVCANIVSQDLSEIDFIHMAYVRMAFNSCECEYVSQDLIYEKMTCHKWYM